MGALLYRALLVVVYKGCYSFPLFTTILAYLYSGGIDIVLFLDYPYIIILNIVTFVYKVSY